MNPTVYHGRREGVIKPQFFFYLGLAFIIIAAAIYLFVPSIVFLAQLSLCCAAASLVYFGLCKARACGFMVGLSTALIWVMRVAFVLGLISFITVEVLVLTGSYTDADADGADYVIVLGCGVDGETPSLMLQSRIDAAYDYLSRNPDTTAILSGAQGPGEDITEAEAMRRALAARGIDDERMLLETGSRDTIQNLRNSLAMADGGGKVAVVSNDFHLYRARLISSHEGFEIKAVNAPTPRFEIALCFYIREYFSLAKVFFAYLLA